MEGMCGGGKLYAPTVSPLSCSGVSKEKRKKLQKTELQLSFYANDDILHLSGGMELANSIKILYLRKVNVLVCLWLKAFCSRNTFIE